MKIADIHAHIFPEKLAEKASHSIGDFYGVSTALLGVPDDVVLAVGVLGVGHGPTDGHSHAEMIDGVPEHTAGALRWG